MDKKNIVYLTTIGINICFTLSPYYCNIWVSDHNHSLFDVLVFLFYAPQILTYDLLTFIFPNIRQLPIELKTGFLFLSGIFASYLYAIVIIRIYRRFSSRIRTRRGTGIKSWIGKIRDSF